MVTHPLGDTIETSKLKRWRPLYTPHRISKQLEGLIELPPSLDSDLAEFLVMSGLWYDCPALKLSQDKELSYAVRQAYGRRRTRLTRSTKILEKRLGHRLWLEYEYATRFRTLRELKQDIEPSGYMAIRDLGFRCFSHLNSVLAHYDICQIDFRPY